MLIVTKTKLLCLFAKIVNNGAFFLSSGANLLEVGWSNGCA